MDEHIRVVTEGNIHRFMNLLEQEGSPEQRRILHELLLREERFYGLRRERLEALHRCLRDCNERILRVRGTLDDAESGDSTLVTALQTTLVRLLETARVLTQSIQDELRAEAEYASGARDF